MAVRTRSFRRTPTQWSDWIEFLATGLYSKTRWRFPVVLVGMLLARGRRTVTAWFRAAGISRDWDEYYYFISTVGGKIGKTAERLLIVIVKHLPLPRRVVVAVDDSPTPRYGPEVEGAGLHHNPTSGPDDHKFLYGHLWVTLAIVVRHPLWHTIGLPLRAFMYVKRKDMSSLAGRVSWPFRTKLEMAAELIEWIWKILVRLGREVWVVTDGAYAYRPLLKRILPLPGLTFVSRLRRDAGLRSLPEPRKPGERGGRRIYGKQKISLAKRAAHPKGWIPVEATMYGKTAVRMCKTFLATWCVVGGAIRVVIVRDPDGGWDAFFCTNPEASVREILECFADRSAIEQVFHDVKEVWGAGQQQVRSIWANIACFNLNLWMHTLVEMWAWHRPAAELRDRADAPWDNAKRRPSHADRRKALRLACFHDEFRAAQGKHKIHQEIETLVKTLARLAA
jgi:predicted RNase H-like HicB family nuclease